MRASKHAVGQFAESQTTAMLQLVDLAQLDESRGIVPSPVLLLHHPLITLK
jgi:hypothetical protein